MSKSKPNLDELAHLNQELTILNQIAQALNREVELEQALHTVLALVAELFNLRTGWVFLVHPATGVSYLAGAHNLPPALAHQPERLSGGCFCLDTYHAGDLAGAANVNVITCSRLSRLVDGTGGLRFHASIPLYAQEQKLGVLNVASAGWSELSDDDLRLLYTVGDMLSVAIARSYLFARSLQLGAVEERNRLAREIHDTLAQSFSAIVLQLETADALLEDAEAMPRPRHYVQRALQLARTGLEEARRSVLDLRAAPLEGRTLAQAVAALVQQGSWAEQAATHFQLVGDDRSLPPHVEAGLYRIAQELLTNSARHAGARQLTVELTLNPETVTLTVEDDGRGFDPAQVAPDQYGLIGINERVKLLGGVLVVESAPAVGAKATVQVPLSPTAASRQQRI
jgi:two-component system, NarL family, sensor kinase